MKTLIIMSLSLLSIVSFNVHADDLCYFNFSATCRDHDDYDGKINEFLFLGKIQTTDDDDCNYQDAHLQNLGRSVIESNFDVSSICYGGGIEGSVQAVGPQEAEESGPYFNKKLDDCLNADYTEKCYNISNVVDLDAVE